MTGRIRTIKPEWLEDEKLAAASDSARILSVALLLCADDHGNGRAHPLYLASRVWPYAEPHDTLVKLSRGLKELESVGYVSFYEAGNQRYFHIRNWKKHQRVQHPGGPRVPLPSDGAPAEAPAVLTLPSGDSPEGLAPDLRSPTTTTIKISDRDHVCAREEQGSCPTAVGRFDLSTVTLAFSVWRQAANGTAYGTRDGSPQRADYDRAQAVVGWAETQAQHDAVAPAECVSISLRGFARDDGARAKGYPFAWWATDPGRYHAAARARRGAPADEHDRLLAALNLAQQQGDHDRVAKLRERLLAVSRKAAQP